ncbi:MAG: hypothetical protein O2960_11340 [Verrucomicrobia bacterium]|nr:hypothetical protein [Verrucomicrobiota bacterium]
MLYRYKPVPAQSLPLDPMSSEGAALTGLGGWLVLIGIGLTVTPFKLAFGLVSLAPSFRLDVWHQLTFL